MNPDIQQRIRKELDDAPANHIIVRLRDGHFGPGDVSSGISAKFVKWCKLPPEDNATLHVILPFAFNRVLERTGHKEWGLDQAPVSDLEIDRRIQALAQLLVTAVRRPRSLVIQSWYTRALHALFIQFRKHGATFPETVSLRVEYTGGDLWCPSAIMTSNTMDDFDIKKFKPLFPNLESLEATSPDRHYDCHCNLRLVDGHPKLTRLLAPRCTAEGAYRYECVPGQAEEPPESVLLRRVRPAQAWQEIAPVVACFRACRGAYDRVDSFGPIMKTILDLITDTTGVTVKSSYTGSVSNWSQWQNLVERVNASHFFVDIDCSLRPSYPPGTTGYYLWRDRLQRITTTKWFLTETAPPPPLPTRGSRKRKAVEKNRS